MNGILGGVFVNLLSEFLVVVLGVLFAQFVRSRWDRWRYGGWRVIVKEQGQQIHVRPVSPAKAKQIAEMPEELSVFLKGVASGYGWINCDLVTEGRSRQMLLEDHTARTYVIDMDKNPPKQTATSEGGDHAALDPKIPSQADR